MRLDFSQLALNNRAFSEVPMTFCDLAPRNYLSAIIELVAIETGNRKAREHWQEMQLRNLLKHAFQRSDIWKERIGKQKISDVTLSSLPILDRSNVVKQVESEGPLLLPSDQIAVKISATSGSSGMPVKFFISGMNERYVNVRNAAQYFMEGRDLSLNKVQFILNPRLKKGGLKITRANAWSESLSPFIKSGTGKLIEYFQPNMSSLRKELESDSIGYLIAAHWGVETMLQYMDPIVLKRAGLMMWIPLGGAVDPKLREMFTSVGIPVRGSYSAEEVGPIGSECETIAGNYHVATSNVLVEVSADNLELEHQKIGRVLVTHLHSYATPFIRYDIGDFASLTSECACGHNGPTLSNVYGREKNLLLHANKKVSPFYVTGAEMAKIARFKEYRIRQTSLKNIIVEIGGKSLLTPEETAAFVELIKINAGEEFEVEVKAVSEIDWGLSAKRLGFRNDILREG